jgi:hypothetical protein
MPASVDRIGYPDWPALCAAPLSGSETLGGASVRHGNAPTHTPSAADVLVARRHLAIPGLHPAEPGGAGNDKVVPAVHRGALPSANPHHSVARH